MFDVYLYNFVKKENSTKQPFGSGTKLQCVLRRGSSALSPTLELDFGQAGNPTGYNYCYIPDFGRYYYIEDWTNTPPLWVASCTVDVLASYKTQIGAAELYVLRASEDYDGSITDTFYPAKTGCTFDTTEVTTPWTLSGGRFVLGVVNQTPTIGSLCYYVATTAALNNLIDALLDDGLLTANDMSIDGVKDNVLKGLLDPLQYIKSAVYIPYAVAGNAVRAANINGWNWTTEPGLKPSITDAVTTSGVSTTVTKTFTIPKHPQASTRGVYLNQAPFSIYTLTIPPFGQIDIDSTVCRNAASLTAAVSIDIPTGVGILTVACNDVVLNRIEAQVGVPIQLSQVSRDYVGGITSILSGITNAVAGAAGMVSGGAGAALVAGGAGVAGSAVGSIGNAVKALTPRAQSVGSGGSYAQLLQNWRLDAQFFTQVDDDPDHNGRPLCELAKPSVLTGYMLIQDGDVPTGGTKTEDAQIRAYLESGFYYE